MNPRPPEIPPHKLLSTLRGYNLLPAIIFMPTRRKCDEAALEVSNDKSQKTDVEKQNQRVAIFEEFVIENPEIEQHKHVRILLNSGVASHHAGHIPPWKLLIEKMMSGGLLNAIFATSTVAAGVDFPARTVVVSNADARGNDGWRTLRASELQQMTGRAGRRGKDNVGFVILTPGQFQNPKKIAELLKAPPDPLESQFRSTYTSLLNLLDAFKSFEQVREIAQKSFAFQKVARQIDQLKIETAGKLRNLEEKLAGNTFGITLNDVRGFERLSSARGRLQETIPMSRAELRRDWLEENVLVGRIISQGRSGKRLFIVINVHGEKVTAMRDDGQGTSIALDRVNRIYQNIYSIKEKSIERVFFETIEGKNPPVEEPKLSAKRNDSDGATEMIDSLIKVISESDSARAELLWNAAKDAAAIEQQQRDIEFLYSEIWLPFERRAKVLDHFGYVDFRGEQVTESGKWLADVRVDRTLLVGEALRRGILDELAPKTLAGLMAALAADSDRNYGDLYLSNELLDVVNDFEDIIYDVSNVEWKFGIEPSEEINLSAAAAAERWAGGMAWDDLVKRTKAEEGDLFRLLARTGEALMQIAHLKKSNPVAAEIARTTAKLLLREPIR
jgi:ATP-dependent RNA helicase HelY